MPDIQILNRWTGAVLYTEAALSFRDAVVALVEALRGIMAHPHVTAYLPYDPSDPAFAADRAALAKLPKVPA